MSVATATTGTITQTGTRKVRSVKEAYELVEATQRPFTAINDNRAAFFYKGIDALLEGPAGTGKSMTLMNKLFALAEKYPGCRILMVRKTRVSMTESTLVTWEEKVVPEGHECLKGPTRASRSVYIFPNGSIVAVGGMDKPSRLLSTEWDIIYVMEATELTEREWEMLKMRLRHYKIPWQQIIGDCNPDAPDHWLNLRCDNGKTRRFMTRHEDNPALFDWYAGEWTVMGKDYIATLDSLTGMLKDRYRHGIWSRAEGIVFTEYDPKVHLIDQFKVPADWPSYWVFDFGFTNPFVWQEWREDNDGRLFRTREIYMTGRTTYEHCQTLKGIPNLVRPKAVICDHDAEDRRVVEQELGVRTKAAKKDVLSGLNAARDRLKVQEDGYARAYFCRDATIERDGALRDGIPWNTEKEFGSYVWEKKRGERGESESPVKRYDHGMDAYRYLVMHLDHKEGKSFRLYPTGGRALITEEEEVA